ncbi:MAG TPA: DUF1849 family protein [Dongiaceae bacterium]|nr:DUF1849 family protein [Dongiaceae bacterium]
MRPSRGRRAIITVSVLSGTFAGALALVQSAAAATVQLLPHRAIYELSARPGNGFGSSGSVRGLLTYEISDGCDGWSVNQKAGIDLSPPEGDSVRFEWSQATWEAKDSTAYRYVIKEGQAGGEATQRRGELRYGKPGAEGTLTTELPGRSESRVPSALLPVQHTKSLIEHAAAGDPIFYASIFDATVDERPVEISASIGPASAGWATRGGKFAPLENVKSRHVDFAFFVDDLPDGTPDFEQSIQLYDNGVIGEVNFEFAGLQVEGTLRKLEMLEPQGCE